MKQYKNIIYAGTFDHLHIGHKTLLDKAFSLADKVSMGITSNEMVKNKLLSQTIQTLDIRRLALETYLKDKKYFKKARIFVLDDIYGPSVGKTSADSLLVTTDTLKNGQKVNLERQRRGLTPFELVITPLVLANDGRPVTSERIRLGEIDRVGNRYQLQVASSKKKTLHLPENMREELRKPLGTVINSEFGIRNSIPSQTWSKQILNSNSQKEFKETAKKVIESIKQLKISPPVVISVGDIITISLLRQKYIPDISIIDLRSRRESLNKEKVYKRIQLECGRTQVVYVKTKNKAGEIRVEAGNKIQETVSDIVYSGKKSVIEVDGEEDLLALPAILFAPLHSIVLYGQWNLGVVIVDVTEDKKEEVKVLLDRFR